MSNKVFIANVSSFFEHTLYFEEKEKQQQQRASAEVATTNNGQ